MTNELTNITNIDYQAIVEIFDNMDIRQSTSDEYKFRIKLFVEFIQTNGLDINSFLKYKRYLEDRKDMSISTKNKYLTSARIFLKEASKIKGLPDITQNIKGFKQTKKHKKDGVNKEEITMLIAHLQSKENTKETVRLKAIISILMYQGLRQVEVSRIDIEDLNLIEGTVLIKGKGSDDKELVYLHPETVKHIKGYIRAYKVSHGALFFSTSNNSKNKRLSTRTIRGLVKSLLGEVSIEKSTHGFRHFFTTSLVEAYKGNLLQVAKYTRHSSLEMLQVYNDEITTKKDLPNFFGAFDYSL